MKKVLTIILSALFMLSVVGCGNGTSKTENINQQSYADEPRPLAMRNDILQELQAEYETLKTEYENLEDGDKKKDEIKAQMKNNHEEQTTTIAGINGEENFHELTKRVNEYLQSAQRYNDKGEAEKAAELLEIVNVISYGNKEGEKTW